MGPAWVLGYPPCSVDLHGVTSSGRELEVGVGREMEELGFSSTMFLTVSMFSLIILVRGRPGSLDGETSLEFDNSGEGVTVRKLTPGDNLKGLRNSLLSRIFHSLLQSKCFVGVKMF